MKAINLLFFLLIFGSSSLADDNAAKKTKAFPQSGVLASHGVLANMGVAIPQLPMGMTGDAVPILGSLSLSQARDGQGTWSFEVQNSSDTNLKVSVELAQFDGLAKKISSQSFSYKIKKGSKSGEKIQAVTRSAGAALILRGWSEIK